MTRFVKVRHIYYTFMNIISGMVYARNYFFMHFGTCVLHLSSCTFAIFCPRLLQLIPLMFPFRPAPEAGRRYHQCPRWALRQWRRLAPGVVPVRHRMGQSEQGVRPGYRSSSRGQQHQGEVVDGARLAAPLRRQLRSGLPVRPRNTTEDIQGGRHHV